MSESYPIGTGYSAESIANVLREQLLSGEDLSESDYSFVTSIHPELLIDTEDEVISDA